MSYIDLTQPFITPTPVYPGDPSPTLEQIATVAKDGFTDHRIETAMHIGTHMDAPLHMITEAKKLYEFPVEKFIGTGKLLDARDKKEIDGSVFEGVSVLPGDIVLIHTGWSSNYGKDSYFTEYPVLTEDFAQAAIAFGAKIIGIDTPSPDREPYAVHKLLLEKEILIIENLTNLDQLVGLEDFDVFALPVPWPTDAAPVRVVAQTY